jgi:hypothetical protein
VSRRDDARGPISGSRGEDSGVSTTIPLDKRILLPAAVAALAALGVGLALLLSSGEEPGRARGDPRPAPPAEGAASPPAKSLEQADWKVSFTRAGTSGRLSRRAVTRLRAQRPRLTRAVRAASDAMFLGGNTSASSYFRGPARGAFRRSGAGAPEGAQKVRTLRRAARVAIQATTAKRAAASVTVIARGVVDGRDFKVRHRSQLWLERTKRGWKVIAFDIDQRPMRLSPKRGKPAPEKKE